MIWLGPCPGKWEAPSAQALPFRSRPNLGKGTGKAYPASFKGIATEQPPKLWSPGEALTVTFPVGSPKGRTYAVTKACLLTRLVITTLPSAVAGAANFPITCATSDGYY